MRHVIAPALLVSLLTVVSAACGDDDDDPPSPDAPAAGPDAFVGPVGACAEIPAADCFSNYDCAAATDRCLDVGAEGTPVPCCVAGPRGTKAAGEPCDPATGELDCASSICIEGDTGAWCSKTCTVPGDCPPGMQSCMPIAFSGSPDSWCFPE